METLFIVKDSPFTISRSLYPLTWSKKNDGVIFIHEGVYITKKKPENVWNLVEELKDKGVKLYILDADLKARALKDVPAILKKVDYDGFIDLVTEYERVF